MKARKTYVLASSTLAADRYVIAALSDLAGYAPQDPAYSPEALAAREAALIQAEREMHRARLAFDAAREAYIKAGWELHDGALGAKAAVYAQFGPESDAIHALGLKRRSERKRRPRRVEPSVSA